jgi:glutamine synthetase
MFHHSLTMLFCFCNSFQNLEYANWERGFGDFHMVPDWSSLRHVSWLEKTVMILCDIHDNKSHELVSVAPRSILRKQIAAANDMGYPTIYSASELEYYQVSYTNKMSSAIMPSRGEDVLH